MDVMPSLLISCKEAINLYLQKPGLISIIPHLLFFYTVNIDELVNFVDQFVKRTVRFNSLYSLFVKSP